MRFIKKSEVLRREKVKSANIVRGEENTRRKNAAKGILTPIGRRMFDLSKLATDMWCNKCDIPLSFRLLEKEEQHGLASVYKLRCCKCLELYEICSSSTSLAPVTSQTSRSMYSVNLKFALGCIDAGIGHEQLNKILSTANLPTMGRKTFKKAEERIGPCVVEVAEESCVEAIAEEKALTQKERSSIAPSDNPESEPMDISPPTTPRSSRPTNDAASETPCSSRPQLSLADSEEVIEIEYDFGWDKRGTGFQYNSHSGRGSIFGKKSKKCLGYAVFSSHCYMCARGLKPGNHICAKNYEGKAKGTEPVAAVQLCVRNENLKKAGVRVGTLIGDRDSSTMAALRRESPHPIAKAIDMNHNTKTFGGRLWALKKTKYRFLTSNVITHLKRCLVFSICQNKNDPEGVRRAIKNIAPHNFGEHGDCGDWRGAKDDPDGYVYEKLPGKKRFSCPVWREDLEALLNEQAADAEQLAPCGSTQVNESFNHMVNSRAPKRFHYCGTKSNFYRVSAAVSDKNIRHGHVERVLQKALLSPSCGKFRRMLEKRRDQKAKRQQELPVKRRRLFLKTKNSSHEATSSRKEGMTYVSGMSSTMEGAAAAATVSSWLPEPTSLENICRPVIVDIETTGLLASSEIVQLAAKCGDEEFSAFILPRNQFSPQASALTGMTLKNGKLWQHGEALPTVPALDAAKQFLEFLRRCSSQVILVGHNIIRFDARRIVVLFKQFNLVQELCNVVFGLTDTIPLISQGKMKKQELLASTYLKGPQWAAQLRKAHDALADCILLGGLLEHFKVSEDKIKECTLPMRDFFEKMAIAKKKKDNTPALMAMAQHKVSKAMIGKMAGHGVTIAELRNSYVQHGRNGLECCLGVQIDGAPRVTRSKKIIDQVENFLKSQLE